jgi:hypothetical protein
VKCIALPVPSDARAAHLARPKGVSPRWARGCSAEGTWPKAAKLSLLSFCTLSVRPALPIGRVASARARTARPLSQVARLQPNGAARMLSWCVRNSEQESRSVLGDSLRTALDFSGVVTQSAKIWGDFL